MSFDSLFDYSNAISFLEGMTDACNTNISMISSKIDTINQVANVFPYMRLDSGRISHLEWANTTEYQTLNKYQTLLGSVQNVTTMDANDKANIYDCYKYCVDNTNEINVPQFMGRLICNKDAIVNDIANVAGAINDSTITKDQGNVVPVFVYNNYNIPNNDNVNELLPYF